MTYAEQLNQITRRYNDAIHGLQDSYLTESTSGLGWNLTSSYLKRQYSKKYDALHREYREECRRLLSAYETSHPEWSRWRHIWTRLFIVGVILLMGSCVFQLPANEEETSIASTAYQDGAEKYWSAENIPIPFLKDSTQYVSNPDNVLNQLTVDQMNTTLKRLDNELGIESVVIIVNHILNDDPFRMAQDVGNRYGVGRGDRGLVVVVGYQDHSINISPGRALEADLTDAECHRLQQQYVVPAMRAEQPDSAMYYLTEALYATLQKKDMPVMSRLSSSDDADDESPIIIGIYLLLLIGWCSFYLHLNQKYQWLRLTGTLALLPNPFIDEYTHVSGGGFGGGRGGGFGGGGFSGCSFGGGSFGGGGATSRW